MSKTQFILLTGVISFYVLLFTYLMLSVCVNLIHVRRRATREAVSASGVFIKKARGRAAWTRAVWREKITQQVRERTLPTCAATASHPRVLC